MAQRPDQLVQNSLLSRRKEETDRFGAYLTIACNERIDFERRVGRAKEPKNGFEGRSCLRDLRPRLIDFEERERVDLPCYQSVIAHWSWSGLSMLYSFFIRAFICRSRSITPQLSV